MVLSRKNVFLKAWLWSIIGGASLVALFWVVTDIINVFQKLHSLTIFTNIFISISVVGNSLGAGLVIWRIADRYYQPRLKEFLTKYIYLSLINIVLALAIIFINTPLTILIGAWNLVAPLCVVRVIFNKNNQTK